mmetsp:Transcript_65326/g.96638  ORF Transcript_65326/g.96638 Transcript_65326/m.96638 type:complete len:193 (-) Transcript_65326:205-783(-)
MAPTRCGGNGRVRGGGPAGGRAHGRGVQGAAQGGGPRHAQLRHARQVHQERLQLLRRRGGALLSQAHQGQAPAQEDQEEEEGEGRAKQQPVRDAPGRGGGQQLAAQGAAALRRACFAQVHPQELHAQALFLRARHALPAALRSQASQHSAPPQSPANLSAPAVFGRQHQQLRLLLFRVVLQSLCRRHADTPA